MYSRVWRVAPPPASRFSSSLPPCPCTTVPRGRQQWCWREATLCSFPTPLPPRRQVGGVLPARSDPQSTRGGLGRDRFLDCGRREATLSYQGHFDQILILVPRSPDGLLLPEFPMRLQQGQKLVRKSQPLIACVLEVEPGLGCSEDQQPLLGPSPTRCPRH